jgi:heme b synthase
MDCRASSPELTSPADIPTDQAFAFVDSLAAFASPILILSGGEPLYRDDIFDIAARASGHGLRVALATNGTLVTEQVAARVARAGIRRASISFDGADAQTHDSFRGVPGSFDLALRGMAHLKAAGVEVQINSTIARHNVHQTEQLLQLALDRGAVALHIFMLVPVGCGVQIADEQMIDAEQYERVLGWFYEMSRRVDIELKATCAPHYFRIMRQRAREEGRKITVKSDGMAAVTKGCLAGQAVCFVSHRGDVFPCGYLPVSAGNILERDISEIWRDAEVFRQLRDDSNLKGKCRLCEYRAYCMGCRARAYAATGDYLAEEPYCIYVPRRTALPSSGAAVGPGAEGAR